MPQQVRELEHLVAQFTARLDVVVRATVTARVDATLLDFVNRLVPALPTPVPQPPQARRPPRLCLEPGCTKPAAGPKYRWRCREHGAKAPQVQQSVSAKLQASLQPAHVTEPPIVATVVLPQARTATILPADVKITRLPPGPMPKERKIAAEARTRCQLPGCLERHAGPRYDFFCRDHYAQLNADERKKYRQLWRTALTQG
jgi:hypothetical protein